MSLNKSKALRTAEKYVLQGKIPAAIDEYRKVVSADPGDLTTINTLGDLYVRAGRIQDAISNFSRIADSYREGGFTLKAIAMLKKISKLDPTNVETAMKLANLYSQQGLLVEARQQYLQVADAYARAGQTRKALEAYQKIADLDPSNTSVRMKLAEIYSRESMTEQAHDAFIMAGAEFLRKGDGEQALNANLKAIVINPDSRQALTAIATIYTQQGQTDRAINLLCEAFERNPGDVELLTILGRTYLSAGMMDDAERTFLSLVELDKNRYHYLLEVGRRFLQIGDLDRAAEQIDGCIEVLIAKREEDKAIDFLRRVLDKEMNHIGALRRLAQIFLRIREDHNLIATLNSLVEAAMRRGDDQEAIAALKELARLEPDEPLHLQRLYNLGVQDIVEADSPDVVRATGPLDFQSAAFDDTFVIRQISEAEILAGHGQVSHAIEILTAILVYAPENVQVHLKLKDIYLRAGIMDKASQECLQLASIHQGRGETARSSDYLAEARQLNPLIDSVPPPNSGDSGVWPNDQRPVFGHAVPEAAGQAQGNGSSPGFEIRDSSGLDWSRYQTGALADSAFVTVPEGSGVSGNGSVNDDGSDRLLHTHESDSFRYSDTVLGDPDRDDGPAADKAFNSASLLPSDTMPRVLRDELEGIDFYIAQGYVEIARDTLERLREQNGDHPEILARYKRLGEGLESDATEPAALESKERSMYPPPEPQAVEGLLPGFSSSAVDGPHEEPPAPPLEVSVIDEETAAPNYEQIEPVFSEADELETSDKPFLIQKESGPLYPDLLVQLNTSELLSHSSFKAMLPVERPQTTDAPSVEDTPDLEEPQVEDMPRLVEPSVTDAQQEIPLVEDTPWRGEPRVEDAQQETPDVEETPWLTEPRVEDVPHSVEAPNVEDPPRLASEPPVADTPGVVEEPRPASSWPVPEERVGTGDLIQSLVANIETSFDYVRQNTETSAIEHLHEAVAADLPEQYSVGPDGLETESRPAVASDVESETTSAEVRSARDELREIFDELKEQTGDLKPLIDFETHYSLGLAYKDMDLLDEAISEFQMAFRTAGAEDLEGDCIHCCNMLGVCFKRKQIPSVAIMWFERGLKMSNRSEDEYQALRFEIGVCYEEMGELNKALEMFTQVYGIDVNYRKVGEKIKELQAASDVA